MSFKARHSCFAPTSRARSANMRAIKSRGNRTTELKLRAMIVRLGIRGWQMHASIIEGCPDFFFTRERIAVFVDGCFWHGCPTCGHTPRANRQYWSKKLARNRARDIRITRALRSTGIRVLRLWECRLREAPGSCIERLLRLRERANVAGSKKAPRSNFVNTPLRSGPFIWYKQFTESSVWLAGRICRNSRRRSGI